MVGVQLYGMKMARTRDLTEGQGALLSGGKDMAVRCNILTRLGKKTEPSNSARTTPSQREAYNGLEWHDTLFYPWTVLYSNSSALIV